MHYLDRTQAAYNALKENAAARSTTISILDAAISGSLDDKVQIDGTNTDAHGSSRRVIRVKYLVIFGEHIDCVVKIPRYEILMKDCQIGNDAAYLRKETGGFEALFEKGENVPYFCLVVQRRNHRFLMTADLTEGGRKNVSSLAAIDQRFRYAIRQTNPATMESKVIWSDIKIKIDPKDDYLSRGEKYLKSENVFNLNSPWV